MKVSPSHLDSSSTVMGSYFGGSSWTGILGEKRFGSGSCSTIVTIVYRAGNSIQGLKVVFSLGSCWLAAGALEGRGSLPVKQARGRRGELGAAKPWVEVWQLPSAAR